MKTFIQSLLGLTLVLCNTSYASELPAANVSCASALQICEDYHESFSLPANGPNGCSPGQSLYFLFNFTGPSSSGPVEIGMNGLAGSYTIYGPMANYNLGTCAQIDNYTVPFVSGTYTQINSDFDLSATQAGYYLVKITPNDCSGWIKITLGTGNRMNCSDNWNCANCVTSFAPQPGKYIVSAWVKEANKPYATNYDKSKIVVSFTGASQVFNLTPSGLIIDGWQRIEDEIVIPDTATGIEIKLEVTQGDAYFDDIRFFPYDGSMMSYVYDPQNLRLMAQLDERNFATLYEYDEEGKLVRVKKETEKGVMTIQENRDHIKKQP
jgi:hypothetical protein